MSNGIDRRNWKEFRDTKLLWWINRILHTFGWAIVVEINDLGLVSDVYPARVSFRGFSLESEEQGFIGLTSHLAETIGDLKKEVDA